MAKKIKIRASAKKGYAKVKAILNHPMETGLRKNKQTGEKIPAHYIQEVDIQLNGTTVMTVNMGIAVSRNPYLSLEINGAGKDDKVMIGWKDNLGESASAEVAVR